MTDKGGDAALVGVALRRRRVAAQRCVPLGAGRRDPWGDGEVADLSPLALRRWQEALHHLQAHGLPGRLPRALVDALSEAARR